MNALPYNKFIPFFEAFKQEPTLRGKPLYNDEITKIIGTLRYNTYYNKQKKEWISECVNGYFWHTLLKLQEAEETISKKRQTKQYKKNKQKRTQFQRVKDAISWEQTANRYKFTLVPVCEKYAKTNCLFHEDKTPSLVLYHETKTYKCFGCGAKGDIIDFYNYMEEQKK